MVVKLKMRMNKLVILFLAVLSFSLMGCSQEKQAIKNEEPRPLDALLSQAQDAVNSGSYDKFNELFINKNAERYTKEDFDKLRKTMMEGKNENTYLLYSYDGENMVTFNVYKEREKYYLRSYQVIPEDISYYMREALEPAALSVASPTESEIYNKLFAPYIYGVTWSPDKSCVAFVRGDPLSLNGQMYLWKVGERNAQLIDGVYNRICAFIWSPDSSTVIADSGTYVTRCGNVVSVKDYKPTFEFGYVGEICWSPDFNEIAVGAMSDVKPDDSLDFTTDLAVYNIKTGEKKILDKASSSTYLTAKKWNTDGIIEYTRNTIKGSGGILKYKYR